MIHIHDATMQNNLYWQKTQAKILSPMQLQRQLAKQYRNQQHRLVLTNGVFDIMHKGHTHYLMQARSLGDALLVAVNSDASVKTLQKGADRPICPIDDRLWMLACLDWVDYVCVFDTPTPVPLIAQIQPDIYVKGGDYTRESLPETPVVQAYGGEVKILHFVDGYSTSHLLQKIRA